MTDRERRNLERYSRRIVGPTRQALAAHYAIARSTADRELERRISESEGAFERLQVRQAERSGARKEQA